MQIQVEVRVQVRVLVGGQAWVEDIQHVVPLTNNHMVPSGISEEIGLEERLELKKVD